MAPVIFCSQHFNVKLKRRRLDSQKKETLKKKMQKYEIKIKTQILVYV